MKKLSFILVLTPLLLLNFTASCFPEGTSADAQFSNIAKDIPNVWWDGGWDKLKELQDFITNNRNETALCAPRNRRAISGTESREFPNSSGQEPNIISDVTTIQSRSPRRR